MFTFRTTKILILATLLSFPVAALLPFSVLEAQTSAETQAQIEDRRAILREELRKLEEEIANEQGNLEEKRKERASLERDIDILESQIRKHQLSIRARDINIENITRDIRDKELTIEELSLKERRERDSLAQLIRKTNELDDYSIVEVILSNNDFSDFFRDVDEFNSVKVALRDSFRAIEEIKGYTEEEKEVLESKRIEEQDLRQIQVLEKRKIEEQEGQKERLLNITKGEEKKYREIIEEKEKTAAEIRAELFQLRDTRAIPFGDAYDLAKVAAARLGIRPAFLLGVIAEESNLGENVGTGNWISDMHPERDRPVFAVIAQILGFNPDTMPVSKKPWYGWGGAMGPAQFIPSTWACYSGYINSLTGSCRWGKSYTGEWTYNPDKDRIRKLVGENRPGNPWEPKDAFMASADLLVDNGAIAGNFEAERLAALRYFAGWVNASKPAYAFYGDDVMELSAFYQKQIDILEGR